MTLFQVADSFRVADDMGKLRCQLTYLNRSVLIIISIVIIPTGSLKQCCTEVIMFERRKLTCLKSGLYLGGKAPMSSARCEYSTPDHPDQFKLIFQ